MRGKNSTNISTVVTELNNLTNPGNKINLKPNELWTSLDVLVQLVRYNSWMNNSVITSATDQQNIVQVASNLLEEENTDAWFTLQEVYFLLFFFFLIFILKTISLRNKHTEPVLKRAGRVFKRTV